MTDLVEQLRDAAQAQVAKAPPMADHKLATLLTEAADEIQWLNLRIQRLEGMA